VDNWIIMKRWS